MSDDDVGFTAPDALPTELKHLKAFLCWRLTPARPGEKKPRKVPYYASGAMRSGTQGEQADLDQLVTYAEAVAAGQRNGCTGIGIAITAGLGIVALDFDNVVVDGVIDPAVEELCSGTYTEFSPSGTGIRAFMRGDVKSRKDTTGEHGAYALEVFGDSGFVTITGNVTPLCDMLGENDVVAPLSDVVIAEYESRWGSLTPGGNAVALQSDDNAWLLNLGMRKGWTLEEGRDYLMDCDPSCGRDQWVKAAMAIHFEFEGSEAAYDIFHTWSKLGKSYAGPKDVESIWRSFKRSSGGQITGIWLLSWRKECLKRQTYIQVEGWKAEMTAVTTEYDLREKLVVKIAEDGVLGDVERQILAQCLQDAFKRLGVKLPIAQCRKMLTKKMPVKPDQNFNPMDESEYPEWLKGYVYITDLNQFYRRGSEEYLDVQAFNAKYSRFMHRDDNGMVTISASVMALEQYQLMTVTRCMYVPWAAPVFREEGSGTVAPSEHEALTRSWMVNSYRPSAVPVAVEQLTPEAIEGIKIMLFHIIEIVCGGRQREGALVLSSMAHNVQHPGIKQRWAPLIQGIEGDGKSLIGGMLSAVMGAANVKSITPTVIARDFTSWGHGACVAIFEELRITGHNKHEIHNRIKPFITNDRIEIHPKGKDAYDVINTQNYFAFTNYKDAIPLTDDDRRFMVIYSRFDTKEQLNKHLEKFGGNQAYFDKLHHAIAKYGREFRRFLLDYKLHPDFNANGRAPDTTEKRTMSAFNKSDDEILFSDIVERGAIGVSKNVLCSKYLRRAAMMEDGELVVDNFALNRILIKMGFSKVEKRVKWNDETNIGWYRGDVRGWGDEARKLLDATLPENADSFKKLFDTPETDIWGDPVK